MIRRIFLSLFFSTFISSGLAAEQSMTAAEIEAVLLGNTIDGTWAGSKYKQYYGKDGFTMYVADGSKPSPGKWRVNSDTDDYESWWESTGWTPYKMTRDGETYYWIGQTEKHQFAILEGKQVKW